MSFVFKIWNSKICNICGINKLKKKGAHLFCCQSTMVFPDVQNRFVCVSFDGWSRNLFLLFVGFGLLLFFAFAFTIGQRFVQLIAEECCNERRQKRNIRLVN